MGTLSGKDLVLTHQDDSPWDKAIPARDARLLKKEIAKYFKEKLKAARC